MCRYLRAFEADLNKLDLVVQSRLKPAWRASRAENLLKIDLGVQTKLKLAWRASRADNSVKFDLSVQFPWCQAAISALRRVASLFPSTVELA